MGPLLTFNDKPGPRGLLGTLTVAAGTACYSAPIFARDNGASIGLWERTFVAPDGKHYRLQGESATASAYGLDTGAILTALPDALARPGTPIPLI